MPELEDLSWLHLRNPRVPCLRLSSRLARFPSLLRLERICLAQLVVPGLVHLIRSPRAVSVPDESYFRFCQHTELIDQTCTADNTTDVHTHAPTFGQCGTSQITYNHLPTALIPIVPPISTRDASPSHTKRSPSIATAAPYANALTPIPDELMTSIYSYCSRSTLLNCMLVDRRQFSLVVPIVWRSVRSPEGNLKQLRGFCSDAESHWVSFGYYSCISTGKWLTRLNLTLNFCL